jgi:quinoprotein relay system zinc metallohydrolase 2
MNHYVLNFSTKKIKISFSLLYIIIFFFLSYRNCLSFEVEEVVDGLFVHFGKQEDSNTVNKGDIANIGFIIGSKSIAVIDTGGTPEIGKSLLKKIKEISKLPISHIIITHSHPDHFFGTQELVNNEAVVLGHEKLERALINNFEFYKNLQFNLIKKESIKQAKLIVPNQTVKVGSIETIDLGNREIEIQAWKSGHTDNDLSIYDKKTKFFWSENIFIQRIPSIRASIKGWKSNLDETLKMDIDTIIPGHGPLKKKNEAINPMMNYFDRLIKEVRKFHKTGKTLKETQNRAAPKNKEKWLLFDSYHNSNITKTYTELEWE